MNWTNVYHVLTGANIAWAVLAVVYFWLMRREDWDTRGAQMLFSGAVQIILFVLLLVSAAVAS